MCRRGVWAADAPGDRLMRAKADLVYSSRHLTVPPAIQVTPYVMIPALQGAVRISLPTRTLRYPPHTWRRHCRRASLVTDNGSNRSRSRACGLTYASSTSSRVIATSYQPTAASGRKFSFLNQSSSQEQQNLWVAGAPGVHCGMPTLMHVHRLKTTRHHERASSVAEDVVVCR